MIPPNTGDSSDIVFLIEDDQDIRSSIVEILSDEGFQTEWASNGEEALAKLRKVPIKPKLILLDLKLPIKNGYQFRIEQRLDPELAEIPVVVISADGPLKEKMQQFGADELLNKPIEIEDLLEVVQKYLH